MPDGADRPASAEAQVGDAAASPHALLQVWLSPAFPVGAFAYSHGLEKAAEFGWIKDRATLEAWLADLVADGGLRNDLIFLASAWRAVSQRDDAGLTEVAELALAFQPSAERYLETTQQGRSFLGQIDAAWPTPVLVRLKSAHGREIAYPIALGLAAAAHDVPLADALRAYALAFTSNLVSAAIRLSVVGQTDGQRIIASLFPALDVAARFAATAMLDELGGAAFRSDIASLAHETQYTRLFRS